MRAPPDPLMRGRDDRKAHVRYRSTTMSIGAAIPATWRPWRTAAGVGGVGRRGARRAERDHDPVAEVGDDGAVVRALSTSTAA